MRQAEAASFHDESARSDQRPPLAARKRNQTPIVRGDATWGLEKPRKSEDGATGASVVDTLALRISSGNSDLACICVGQLRTRRLRTVRMAPRHHARSTRDGLRQGADPAWKKRSSRHGRRDAVSAPTPSTRPHESLRASRMNGGDLGRGNKSSFLLSPDLLLAADALPDHRIGDARQDPPLLHRHEPRPDHFGP